MRSIGVLIFLFVGTAQAETVKVSRAFLRCVEYAKQMPDTHETSYPDGLTVDLSEKDSALTACFLKFANREKFGYARCFEVASVLPTPFSRAASSQACLSYWYDKGSVGNCVWGANRVGKWLKLDAHRAISSSIGQFYTLQPHDLLGFPGALLTRPELSEVCTQFDRDTKPRQLAAQQAEIARRMQGGDPVPGKEKPRSTVEPAPKITRIVANRPLTDVEQKVCSLSVETVAGEFHSSRVDRALKSERAYAAVAGLLKGVPDRAREWIRIGMPEKSRLLLEFYASRTSVGPTIASLDPVKRVVTYKYVTVDGTLIEGEISIHKTWFEDLAELEAKMIDPGPGGWKGYFTRNGVDGCPFPKEPPQAAFADDRVKNSEGSQTGTPVTQASEAPVAH